MNEYQVMLAADPDVPPPQWSGWEEVIIPGWACWPVLKPFPQGIGEGLAARVAAALNQKTTP
jgi:hypothetical protein